MASFQEDLWFHHVQYLSRWKMKWNEINTHKFLNYKRHFTHTHACFSLINFSLSLVCVCVLYTIKSITNLIIIIIIIKRLSNCSSFPIYYIPGTHNNIVLTESMLMNFVLVVCGFLSLLFAFSWCFCLMQNNAHTHSNENNLQVHKVHNGNFFFCLNPIQSSNNYPHYYCCPFSIGSNMDKIVVVVSFTSPPTST